MKHYSNYFLAIIAALLLMVPAFAVESLTNELPNGIYLILKEEPTPEKLEPLGKSQRILVKDDHFLEPPDRGQTSYLLVSEDTFIPIVLGSDPEKGKDANGRPKLLLTLEKKQIKPLEEFTTKNVNKSIAIVIGKDVVTTHKIRQPIIGGRMQITRCTDNGCEAIYTQLQGKTGNGAQ
jgi:preprotein translocase subunit SecD